MRCLAAVARVHEADEHGESEDLPDGLGGLHGGDQGYQHGIPEPLTEEEDKGEHHEESE